MTGTESPIFVRCYELLKWLIPLTVKFPRQQRFVLAQMTQQCALRLHERLIEAAHGSRAAEDEGVCNLGASTTMRLAALFQADVELEKLRHYMRLCHDLNLITIGQYEYGVGRLSEIGRLLGGWQRTLSRQQGA